MQPTPHRPQAAHLRLDAETSLVPLSSGSQLREDLRLIACLRGLHPFPPSHTMRGPTPTTTARASTRATPTRFAKPRPQAPRPAKTTTGGKAGGKAGAGNKASGTKAGGRSYVNITGFPFPLGPFFERKTVVTEVREG